MPKGSIDYRVMQKTRNACSILLPCRWEDMGTHAALASRIGEKRGDNLVAGKALVAGKRNIVLANTEQSVVVAADNLIVVITEDTVFVGDRDTDMKALVEYVTEQEPKQTCDGRELNSAAPKPDALIFHLIFHFISSHCLEAGEIRWKD
jgi:hypothetical protein